MPRRFASAGRTILPRGLADVIRQLALFAAVYGAYELVRGLLGAHSYKPFADATRIIDFERGLHVFVEPQIQAWVIHDAHWLMDLADWTYLNAQFSLTLAVLIFIYLRRNESFYFVRNMFVIAMLLALIGYAVYPTAPPRLMPQWGFVDSIQQFTHVTVEQGAGSLFVNAYAAVPSMHVCFALMIAGPMSRLVRHRVAALAWHLYPPLIVFVVIATGNHYFTDVFLGAMTAGIAALLAQRLLARARPDIWAFTRNARRTVSV